MTGSVTLAQLRVLLAVAERGSFSEAALDLDLSQSTVSHAVAELERALGGAPLFRRGRRGAVLTDLGERVVTHARTSLGAIEAMRQEVELERGALRGTLRVATLRSAGTHLLRAILADLRSRHPELSVLVLDEQRDASLEDTLNEGRADVSLLSLPLRTSLLAWPLARDEYVVVYPRGRAPRDVTWPELSATPLLLCNEECMRVVHPHVRAHGGQLGTVQEVREDSVILSMVAHGLGASIMPALATDPRPTNIETRSLPEPLWRTIAAATLPQRASQPAVRAFLESARRTWTPATDLPIPG